MKPHKQTRTISRIMVPTDFSPGFAEALEYAIALANRLKADLILAHVIEPFPYNNGGCHEKRDEKERRDLR